MWYKLDEDGRTVVPVLGDFPEPNETIRAVVKQETLHINIYLALKGEDFQED